MCPDPRPTVLFRLLFPNLPAATKVTEKMMDERLKDFVDKPEVVGNEILTLRMSKENGQCMYWMERTDNTLVNVGGYWSSQGRVEQ